jgi:hypothetical protein
MEVDFPSVPGSSGSPVFSEETGRVLGVVRGVRTTKIRETLSTTTMIAAVPPGVSSQYVESVSAVYSIAVKLDFVRAALKGFGIDS